MRQPIVAHGEELPNGSGGIESAPDLSIRTGTLQPLQLSRQTIPPTGLSVPASVAVSSPSVLFNCRALLPRTFDRRLICRRFGFRKISVNTTTTAPVHSA